MERDNTKFALRALVILVIVLSLLVLYAFVLKPAMNGYVVKSQNDGVNYVIASIVNQIQQQGYVQIPVGNETLVLVPYQPEQEVNLVG